MGWSFAPASVAVTLMKLFVAFNLISNCVPVDAITRSEFYSFGNDSGDTGMIAHSLFGSPPIESVITEFPFFGQNHDTFYVYGGGYVTFNTSTEYSTYFNSFPHTSFGIVLPFWTYASYRNQSQVWYRITTDGTLLERARRDVQRAFINHDNFQPLWLLIATWEDVNVDYDYYYYYYYFDDTPITFQCVLATDGVRSFTMFHYEDEMDLSVRNFVRGYLQMGYDAGDGIHYYQHPQSFSRGLFNVFNTSNVGIPGVWIFRLDTEDTAIVQCSTQSFDPISLVPKSGNMLGGTGVKVTGPCLNTTDQIICGFDNKKVEGVYIDETSLLCVSPNVSRVGEVDFELKIIKTVNNRMQELTYVSRFYSVSPDKGHVVNIASSTLMFRSKAKVQVSWPPHQLISAAIPINSSLLSVDISLYTQEYTLLSSGMWRAEWRHLATPVTSIKNSIGKAEVALPPSDIKCTFPLTSGSIQVGVCPIVVKVSVSKITQSKVSLMLPSDIGIWSGIVFLQTERADSSRLRAMCKKWGESEETLGQNGQTLLDKVLTCPPTQNLARFDPNFEEESYRSILSSTQYASQIMGFLHPNIDICFVQVTPRENSSHQCCYRRDGNLALGAPGGGSADSTSTKVDFNRHLSDDMIPFLLCCKSGVGSSNCEEYYNWRPSGKEDVVYVFPIPACIYGDPHIITLDGLKYTFNGKGEFTMIKTTDNSFTLQGRMEPTLDQDGNPTSGTVFTALVAREKDKNTTVQFELQTGGVVVLVDGNKVEFDGITEVIFEHVTVADNNNNTVSAQFSGGAKMEVTVENDIISIMLITLPDSYKEMTQGLMGSFNKDSTDDLVPKSLSKSIPSNSSLEDIHNLFGITWIIDDSSDSLFTYKTGESWETFYDPSFSPAFKPTFEDPVLEEEAKEVCGDDKSCLYDVAATKKVEIGMATMRGVESFDTIVEMSTPIVCSPPCVNGACVKNDTCSCNDGFEGEKCTVPVVSECDVDMCQNNGTCMKHVLTYTCDCPTGFIGAFCQEKEPPFHVRLLNSSPRVSDGVLLIDFETSMPIVSAQCFLTGQKEKSCRSGLVRYTELPAGSYIFRVLAKTSFGERAVVRRIVHVGETEDEKFCAVHLINEGIVVSGRSASLFFKGTKAVDSFLCRLRGNATDTTFTFCRSPIRYEGLEVGEYRFQVLPVGCDNEGKRLSVKFDIF